MVLNTEKILEKSTFFDSNAFFYLETVKICILSLN